MAQPAENLEFADTRAALAGWYLRPRFGIVTLLPLLAGVAICILLALLRGAMEDPRTNLRESTAALMALAPPPVPLLENAAADYGAVAAVYVPFANFDKNKSVYDVLNHHEKLIGDPKVTAYLQANGAALTLLRMAAQKRRCNFGVNYQLGWNIPLPHLGRLREYARLLCVDARVKAHAGDHAGAAADIETLLAMADHVSSDSILISGVVGSAIEMQTDSLLQSIVIFDTPTQAADIELYRRVPRLDRDSEERALRLSQAEKAFALYGIDLAGVNGGLGMSAPRFVQNTNLYAAICYASDRQCMAELMDLWLARLSLHQLSETRDLLNEIAEHRSGPAPLTMSMAPRFGITFTPFWQSQDKARTTDAGLAALLFKLKHGRYPATLDDMVPEFLARVPVSLENSQPLRIESAPLRQDLENTHTDLFKHFNGRKALMVRAASEEPANTDFILPPDGRSDSPKGDF